MTNLKYATATAAVALCATFSAIDSASAANFVYGGGSTLASVVYRQLMDTFDFPLVTGGCNVSATNLSAGDGLELAVMSYSGEGSGAGRRAFDNHDGSTSNSTGLGTATPGLPPPYYLGAASCTTSPAWTGYPAFHFAGTDDPLGVSDIATYNANSGPSKWGKIVQFPTFVAPVTVDYNPTGLNLPPNGLNLTRTMVCGIFSGHITNWADPVFSTSGAGGGPLTSSSVPITVVHRSDGSGTTFIFTTGLREQCSGIVGPNNAFNGDTSNALYEFPWTDNTVASTQCPALPARGTDTANWPDLGHTQCGTSFTISNPGGGTFVGASHSDQVACKVASTTGGIGYVTPDFTALVVTNLTLNCSGAPPAPQAANVQNQYGVDNGSNFITPTPAAALTAMNTAIPNFPTDAAITNPLNWRTQAIVSNPSDPNAYPFSGFTWLDTYQCYNQTTSNGNVLGTIQGFVSYLLGGYNPGSAEGILNQNGFSKMPGNWSDALTGLVLNSSAKWGVGGSGVCSGIPGA